MTCDQPDTVLVEHFVTGYCFRAKIAHFQIVYLIINVTEKKSQIQMIRKMVNIGPDNQTGR